MSSSPLLELPTMRADLGRVEHELLASVESDDEFLTEVAGHLITAGGKRVRPALTVASSLVLEPDHRPAHVGAVRGGVSVELVHQGSLYHDDVMDRAETRRTVQSVNARWGNLQAILAGDYLLARASEIAASLGTEVAGLLASTIARLCEGQVRELRDAFDIERTEEAYFSSIEGKTAALLETASRIGGIVAGHPRAVIDALGQFGRCYGLAFQVVDDILDIVATDEQLGKPAGNDLLEGVYTLPVIRTLATDAGTDLRHILGGPIGPEDRDKARDIVRNHGGIDSALATACTYTRSARSALDGLDRTPAVRAMIATTDLLLGRVAEVTE